VTAEAVADIVARGDPDRWRTAMAAPPPGRERLMALYAFNLEIARAPWAASEPMLAEIRLRWWLDAIEEIEAGAPPRRHEVVEPLAEAIAAAGLPAAPFREMIAARLFDAAAAPHADAAALHAHLLHTSGHLMALAAQVLAAEGEALVAARAYGTGAGYAAFLRALPDYAARGRDPMPPGLGIAGAARAGLAEIAAARARRQAVKRAALPALLPGVLAPARLRRALNHPEGVLRGALEASEFRTRAAPLWAAATGLW
jgi:15-cis-phytoene synthase